MFKKKKRHLDGGQGRGYSETRHPTLKLSQMLVVLKSKFHEFGLFGINFLCSIRNICSGFLQDTFQIKKEKKLQTRLNFINWQTQITIILIHLQSEDQWTWTKDGSFLICHKNKQTNKQKDTFRLTRTELMDNPTISPSSMGWSFTLWFYFVSRDTIISMDVKNCFYYWNIHFPIINKHQELKSLALMCFEGWGGWSNGN